MWCGVVWCDVQGFTWLEGKWHVDLSGRSAEAVDADGWSYAVDFPWLSMPPIPGSGRTCAKPSPPLSTSSLKAFTPGSHCGAVCIIYSRTMFSRPHVSLIPFHSNHNRTVKDFVRRRRWIRTRMPVDAEAAVVQMGGTSLQGGRRGTEFGLVCGQSPPRLHEALSFPHSGALVSPYSHHCAVEQ